MNVEYINPFVGAAFSVFEMMLGCTPQKGKLGIQQCSITSDDVNIVVGVTGAIQGSVVYGMSLTTALAIASRMTMQDLKMLDALGKSALSELANMVSGNAMQALSEAGFICDITPPSLIKGQNVEVTLSSLPALLLPLDTGSGELTITVGLQRNAGFTAAAA